MLLVGGGGLLCRQKWSGGSRGRSESLPTSSDSSLQEQNSYAHAHVGFTCLQRQRYNYNHQHGHADRPHLPQTCKKKAVWTRVYRQGKVSSSLLCCFGIFRTLTMVVTAQDVHPCVSFESIMIQVAVFVLFFLSG